MLLFCSTKPLFVVGDTCVFRRFSSNTISVNKFLYVEQTFSLFRSGTDFTKTDNVIKSFRNGITERAAVKIA